MAKKRKTEPVMADWQPIARAEPLSSVLNDTELLKARIVHLARDSPERETLLPIVLRDVERPRSAPAAAKWEKAKSTYTNILAVESELREAGKPSSAFAEAWKNKFGTRPPSDSTREKARRWNREGRPA